MANYRPRGHTDLFVSDDAPNPEPHPAGLFLLEGLISSSEMSGDGVDLR